MRRENELLVEDLGRRYYIGQRIRPHPARASTICWKTCNWWPKFSELRANPGKRASGVIIEAKLDRKRGPSATVLVTDGTLSVGDHIVAGNASGRVRALIDDKGKNTGKVSPGTPAEILGFGALPEAGDRLIVAGSDREARSMTAKRERPGARLAQTRALSLEEVINRVELGDVKELNLVLKAGRPG